MKKILIALAVTVGLAVPVFSEEFNLQDKTLVEHFGALIVKEKIDLYDSDEFGLWVLQKGYQSKYQKVQNDEFEFNDAKEWAFKNFKKKLEKVESFSKNTEFHLFLSSKFNKYDFKSKTFPIDALSEGTYMNYAGKNDLVQYYNNSKLVFENATDEVNFLPMNKDEAKKFIKLRKDKYGNIDRKLIAHYIYTITDFKEVDEFKPNGSKMTIKFTGKLKSVEFMDKKRKHVLKRVEFNAPVLASTNVVSIENNTTK